MKREKAAPFHKFCPNCNKQCHARCKACPHCSHEFEKAIKQEKSQVKGPREFTLPEGYSGWRVRSTIFVPAGECPIKLKKQPAIEDVDEWANTLREMFLEKNQWLMNHALCYYLRYDYLNNEKEYKRICELVNQLPDLIYKDNNEKQ